jgi:D-alanyl-D-alanine carboxypeptidase
MVHPGDVVVTSFKAIGWGWGGDWHTLKDYMHFSLTGR